MNEKLRPMTDGEYKKWKANLPPIFHPLIPLYLPKPEANNSLESKLLSLKSFVKIQSQDGHWTKDEYLRGLANGLIMAEAIMEDKEPKYFRANYPEKSREEKCPVIPQKILKLDWVFLSRNVEVNEETYIKDLKKKQDEIIDVVNSLK